MKLSPTRLLTNLAASASLSLAGAYHAFAQFGTIPDPVGGGGGTLESIILNIIGAVLNILGLIAVVVIIVAGIRLVVGGQEEGQREKARNAILYAVIGLVIIVLARAIVTFVIDNIT